MYYDNSKGTVYYEVHGKECAPAIIFCHGVAMDHRTFDEQVMSLKDTFRVIVWDMPYHGKSSAIDDKLPYTSTTADVLLELLDSLNIRKSILVGLSLGSFVIQQVVNKDPDRVIATIHISGGPLYPKYPAILKVLKPFINLFIGIYPNKLLQRDFAKHKALKKETQQYLIETVSQTGKKSIIHLTREMLDDMVNGLPEPPAVPMLIIYGDHEISFIKKMNQSWHENSNNSELVIIKDAHHIVNQDNPSELNKVLLNYIQRVLDSSKI